MPKKLILTIVALFLVSFCLNGDCLGKIAEKFNVSLKDLMKWNNIKNPNLIYAGDTLKIF